MTPATLQRFVERLAPADLADEPCVVYFASEVGVDVAYGTSGVYVRSAQRVDPDGPIGAGGIVLDDTRWGDRLYDPLRSLQSVSAHELAHHLVERWQPIPLTVTLADAAAEFRCEVSRPIERPADRPPWEPGHGADFVRITGHLVFRARQMGVDLDANQTLNHRNLWPKFSDGGRYLDALADEAARYQHDRLRDILDTPAPAEFRKLWTDDTSKWNVDDDSNSKLA